MKKIFFAMTVLAGAIFSSCTNEDIEVTTVGKKYNASCTINTQNLYDTFNLSQEIRDNYLRKKTMGVGVMTYLYDAEGKLVGSPTLDCVYNFNPVVVTYEDLLEGDYTIVCVETLVNPDDDFKSIYEIIDTESLSTVALQHDVSGKMVDDNCVAVGTQKFHVERGDLGVNVVPEAIGSRIRCFYYNFIGSEFTQVGTGTDVGLDRYFFDPSLEELDHYYYGYQEEGNFHTINYLNVEDTEDYHGIAYVLDRDWEWYNCYRTAQHNKNQWTTYKARKAELEPGKEYFIGFYNFDKVGGTASKLCSSYEELEAFVAECDKENIDNTPTPTGSYYAPFHDWDKGTVSNVKSYMKNYDLYEDITAENLSLTYFNESGDEMYDYTFATVKGGLWMSAVYTYNITFMEGCSALESEGMQQLSADEDGVMYVSADYRTIAMVMEKEGVVIVSYMDLSAESNQRTPKELSKQMRQMQKADKLSAVRFHKNIELPLQRLALPVKTNSMKINEILK